MLIAVEPVPGWPVAASAEPSAADDVTKSLETNIYHVFALQHIFLADMETCFTPAELLDTMKHMVCHGS